MSVENKEFLTIKEAARLFNKTDSNISYLIQYRRIKKYYLNEIDEYIDSKIFVKKKKNQTPYVSLSELKKYFNKINKKYEEILKNHLDFNRELLFFDLSERERTKHVHRLHPYMGKFIPQLVEYYLKKYFKKNNLILDPFMGSGTTLIEANVKNMNSIGIDISILNCMIARAKLENYNIPLVKREILSIYNEVNDFFNKNRYHRKIDEFIQHNSKNKKIEFDVDILKSNNEYLNKWYASNTIKQMMAYKSLIPKYNYQNLLKIILSRALRSARLTYHYKLTRVSDPVYEPYICKKHKYKICAPTATLLPYIKKYSNDTIKRLTEFSKIRTKQPFEVSHGDSRKYDLSLILENKFNSQKIDGIICSPPYVGLIDYHLEHQYTYELFKLPMDLENEIGSNQKGISITAQKAYQESITKVFINMKKFLTKNAKIFIVANDKRNLYPKIAELSGFNIINVDKRPVTNRASGKSEYFESIFQFSIK